MVGGRWLVVLILLDIINSTATNFVLVWRNQALILFDEDEAVWLPEAREKKSWKPARFR